MSNWNVRRRQPSVAELTHDLAVLQAEAKSSLKYGGEFSRSYRQTMENIRRLERLLETATEKQRRREDENDRDPREIAVSVVDRLMGH